MIRHLVMWKLKPEAVATEEIYKQNLAQVRENFRVLCAAVPEIQNFGLFENINHGGDFYEFVVSMDFEDAAALQRFQVSPAHREPISKAFCLSIRERKATVDYEF